MNFLKRTLTVWLSAGRDDGGVEPLMPASTSSAVTVQLRASIVLAIAVFWASSPSPESACSSVETRR